jgi:hypothetical protein
MIKILSVTLLFFVILSLVVPTNADAALPCPAKILEACYKSCRESFSGDLLRAFCYAGCLIGCVTSGTD